MGESGAVLTTTAGLSLVVPFAKASAGEISSTLYKSLSASQSSTVTTTYNPLAIPGVLGQ